MPGRNLTAQLVEHGQVGPFAAAHDRGEEHDARPLRHPGHRIDDLLGGLLVDFPAADRAVRLADAGEEQPQVVVDLGHRADRGAWVVRDAALVDRDGRGKPIDVIHIGFIELAQELACVRGE